MKSSSGGESKIEIPGRCPSGRSAPVSSPSSTLPAPRSSICLVKFEAETFYHGDPAFSDGARAKNRNTPPPLGKILEKSPTMATTHSWTTISPKPATNLGKIQWEPVYDGDFLKKKRGYAKNGDFRPPWEKSNG